MSELVLEAAFARGLGPLNARFSSGLQLVLARAPADLGALAELLAGVLPARRGRVMLEGDDVGRTPARRREIAALLLHEELIAARDVRTALATACALRGVSESAEALLAALGVSQLLPRDPRTLNAHERRLLALSLALGQTSSRAVVLADPLALAPDVGERFLIDACHRLSETAIVIVLTASLTDALQIGGRVWWLERGRLQPANHGERPFAHQPALLVRSQMARSLARELETDPAVVSLIYDETRAPYELTLRGPELEGLASAAARAANKLGARLDGLHPELPTLDSALLARAGWIRSELSRAGRGQAMNAVGLGFRQGAARLRAPAGATLVLLAAGDLVGGSRDAVSERGRTAADRALISAAFGVALPLLAFFSAELALAGQRFDRALCVLTRHGISGRNAGIGLALALAAATSAAALTVTICALFAAYPASDPRLWSELALTIPIATLAGVAYAGWYTLASSFGANGGGRRWLLVLDWVFGASSSWLALPFPRGHLRNLLGGAPVAEMSQGWALGVLVVGTSLALVIALLRSAD